VLMSFNGVSSMLVGGGGICGSKQRFEIRVNY
jgi:hypothetical protein